MEQQSPYPPLSDAEKKALEILTGYGVDFPAVYIGRARPYLNCGHHDSTKELAGQPVTHKSAQEIVAYVMELVRFDQDQKLYLERRRKERRLENLYEELADKLVSSDPQTQELVRLLLMEVERERFNRGWTPVEIELYETGKLWPVLIGTLNIGGQDFIATASRDQDREGRAILRMQIKPK